LIYAPYPYSGPNSIVTVDMGTNTSLIFDLWDGAAFYVAVTTYNSSESSDYSNVESFTIKQETPAAANLEKVVNDVKAAVNSVDDVINWSKNNLYFKNVDPNDAAPDVGFIIQDGYGDCKMLAGVVSVLLDDVGQPNFIVTVQVSYGGMTSLHMYNVYNQGNSWYVINNADKVNTLYPSFDDTYQFLADDGTILEKKIQVSDNYDEFKAWYNEEFFPN